MPCYCYCPFRGIFICNNLFLFRILLSNALQDHTVYLIWLFDSFDFITKVSYQIIVMIYTRHKSYVTAVFLDFLKLYFLSNCLIHMLGFVLMYCCYRQFIDSGKIDEQFRLANYHLIESKYSTSFWCASDFWYFFMILEVRLRDSWCKTKMVWKERIILIIHFRICILIVKRFDKDENSKTYVHKWLKANLHIFRLEPKWMQFYE